MRKKSGFAGDNPRNIRKLLSIIPRVFSERKMRDYGPVSPSARAVAPMKYLVKQTKNAEFQKAFTEAFSIQKEKRGETSLTLFRAYLSR
jgi:hypothetical protein